MVSQSLLAGISAFLAVGWAITIALPFGWHTTNGSLLGVDYDLCLYKYEVSKGKALEAANIGAGLASNFRPDHKEKISNAVDKGSGLLNIGRHSLADVEDDYCKLENAASVVTDRVGVAGELLDKTGINDVCYMWRRIRIVSLAVMICVSLGVVMVLGAAGLSCTSPSGALLMVSRFGGIFGSFLGVVCTCVYLFMTMDFPNNEGFTFGPVFYISFVLGLLTMGTCAAAAWMSPPPKGARYNDGRDGAVEFQNFDMKGSGKGHGKGAEKGYGHQPPMQEGMHQGHGGGHHGMQGSQDGMQHGGQQYSPQKQGNGQNPWSQQQQGGGQSGWSPQYQGGGQSGQPQMQGMHLNGRMLNFDAYGNVIAPSNGGPMSNPFGR